MHTHQSLVAKGKNAFFHAQGQFSSPSRPLVHRRLLRHARGYCAVTNPLVNSYKRLVSGFEAPVNVSWSTQNVSPSSGCRPTRRGDSLRESHARPCGNPYLAIAVQLAAGLDGIHERIDPASR